MTIRMLAATLTVTFVISCTSDLSPSPAEVWAPYPASQEIAEKSLVEWAVEWNRWSYAQTSCESAFTDDDGSQCALHQDAESPVFFLASASSSALRAQCKLPQGKAILVPFVVFGNDNVAEDPAFSEEELRQHADDALSSMRDQRLALDGKAYAITEQYAVQPVKHTAELPSAPNFYSCIGIDGYEDLVLDPVYVTGYFALLPPPSFGEHTVSYAGAQGSMGFSSMNQTNMRFRVVEND